MKTIVVPTDLSPAANNAARYAMHFAKGIKANINLCNALLVPMDAPMAGTIVWPIEDYDSLKASVDEELKTLAHKLEHREQELSVTDTYHPSVNWTSEIGLVTDVIRNMVSNNKANMVIMGMSGASDISDFFLGSNSRDIIDRACFPVLLIPRAFVFNNIKKIAFATDLSDSDIEIIHSLAGIARCFNAEILISHITDNKYEELGSQLAADKFLSAVSAKVNYPRIYYRHVKSMNVDHGLDWLGEHSMIDMLVMVHRPHDILDRIFKGSHTQKLAKHIPIPLLVFPGEFCAVV
jgi:nucleotide-binding universal stress UspA family protein